MEKEIQLITQLIAEAQFAGKRFKLFNHRINPESKVIQTACQNVKRLHDGSFLQQVSLSTWFQKLPPFIDYSQAHFTFARNSHEKDSCVGDWKKVKKLCFQSLSNYLLELEYSSSYKPSDINRWFFDNDSGTSWFLRGCFHTPEKRLVFRHYDDLGVVMFELNELFMPKVVAEIDAWFQSVKYWYPSVVKIHFYNEILLLARWHDKVLNEHGADCMGLNFTQFLNSFLNHNLTWLVDNHVEFKPDFITPASKMFSLWYDFYLTETGLDYTAWAELKENDK